ncbi:unnamed protein product [Somion occarium]|uniref:SH3 domain-containing protein n=1 Tax=Somion occarium TaxID=3059160 RepID=A0ABP1CHG6_9APHY
MVSSHHIFPTPTQSLSFTGHRSDVGVLWFAIFLQLFLILGVLHTLATDSIAMHRFQISVFGAVAIVFAVTGVNNGIFTGVPSLDAMAAGWLILAIVDILWTLYFTSEEDSLMLHVFNSLGTGGLTPPSRRRRTRPMSVHNMGAANGYNASYSAPPGSGMGPVGYDSKLGGSFTGPIRSDAGSFKQADRSMEARSIGAGSINNMQTGAGGGGGAGSISGGIDNSAGINSPLMGSGAAGVGAGGGPGPTPAGGQTSPVASPTVAGDIAGGSDGYIYRAKAMYAYNASEDDPNEISFAKGEIMEILDKQGKWWQAKKADGTVGSTSPSLSHVLLVPHHPPLTVPLIYSCAIKLPTNYLKDWTAFFSSPCTHPLWMDFF